ncbi:Holliday junction resolvase RuvX [Candidatus Saccharibacteria bacterium TM7i]|nr:Holliday junction resolvase RuvX [Candidatus Saccharibacteria bacterium TM7i]
MATSTLVCLDVGERRIGVATADTGVRIAVPVTTIEVDGTELEQLVKLIRLEGAKTVVVGYPRNQQGEATKQTAYVEAFVERLKSVDSFEADIAFQDESLTSVVAEQYLIAHKKPYTKGDIDARAASIILQDYVEERYG